MIPEAGFKSTRVEPIRVGGRLSQAIPVPA